MQQRTRIATAAPRPIVALVAAAMAAAMALVAAPTTAAEAAAAVDEERRVIVTGVSGAGDEVAALVEAAGGEVVDHLPIVEGVVADVPASAVEALAGTEAVRSVSDDAPITSLSVEDDGEAEDTATDDTSTDDTDTSTDDSDTSTEDEEPEPASPVYEDFDAAAGKGSLARYNRDIIGSGAFWKDGHTGDGVDVVVVDTGIATVAGLDAGQVLHGPDLSFDSQTPWAQTDGYGHGTHMAGIIAGREARSTGPIDADDTDNFLGVAPDSRVISLKIGDHGGAADISQAIAAIDWATSHRNAEGPDGDDLNIRVMNLSFGYNSNLPYTQDPLAYAAEQAWDHGIVVVAAAGNGGHQARLSSPAYHPHILAVGATDSKMTVSTRDDELPRWSSCDPNRNPDVVAPGRSVASLRVPGSYVDSTFDTSKVTGTLTRGSGTSQSAAFVSGAAALILSKYPNATPDEVRALLTSTASEIQKSAPKRCQGHGVIDLRAAATAPLPTQQVSMAWENPSNGTGSLDDARGGYHVQDASLPEGHPDRVLTGERDIFGHTFDNATWRAAAAAGEAFSPQGHWNASQWTGSQWTASQWTASQWTASQWTSDAWSASQWTSGDWAASQWTGSQWTASQWTASQWTASQWTASQWTASQWTASLWASSLWGDDRADGPPDAALLRWAGMIR